MKKLIAYCGLDCEKCDARIATINNNDELRKKTAELWTKLNGVEITADMINCTGCRLSGVKTPFCGSICGIRKCAADKMIDTCADCTAVNECETLKPIISNNANALENLKKAKCGE